MNRTYFNKFSPGNQVVYCSLERVLIKYLSGNRIDVISIRAVPTKVKFSQRVLKNTQESFKSLCGSYIWYLLQTFTTDISSVCSC